MMRARIRNGGSALALATVLVLSGCGSDAADDATDEQGEESPPPSESPEAEEPDDSEASPGAPIPEDSEEPAADADDDEAVAEAVEQMQGVWRSTESNTRLFAVEGETIVLLDEETACTGGHDGGPLPLSLGIYCEGEELPLVANAVADGETLTVDWIGEDAEEFTWLAPSVDALD